MQLHRAVTIAGSRIPSLSSEAIAAVIEVVKQHTEVSLTALQVIRGWPQQQPRSLLPAAATTGQPAGHYDWQSPCNPRSGACAADTSSSIPISSQAQLSAHWWHPAASQAGSMPAGPMPATPAGPARARRPPPPTIKPQPTTTQSAWQRKIAQPIIMEPGELSASACIMPCPASSSQPTPPQPLRLASPSKPTPPPQPGPRPRPPSAVVPSWLESPVSPALQDAWRSVSATHQAALEAVALHDRLIWLFPRGCTHAL